MNSTGTRITLRLTQKEADALALVAGNGWADGEFAEWLDDPQAARATKRAMEKLDAARLAFMIRGTP